jgi:hypothetical protein
LNDHPDAAGDRGLVRHQIFPTAGDVISARRGQRAHVNDDRLFLARLDHPVVDDIGSGHLPARRIDLQHDRADIVVIAGLLQGQPHVVHHRISHISVERRANQPTERDHRDLVAATPRAALHDDLAKRGRRLFQPRAAGKASKRGGRKDQVYEQAGAERHEEKNAKTTQFSIGSHDVANW